MQLIPISWCLLVQSLLSFCWLFCRGKSRVKWVVVFQHLLTGIHPLIHRRLITLHFLRSILQQVWVDYVALNQVKTSIIFLNFGCFRLWHLLDYLRCVIGGIILKIHYSDCLNHTLRIRNSYLFRSDRYWYAVILWLRPTQCTRFAHVPNVELLTMTDFSEFDIGTFQNTLWFVWLKIVNFVPSWG